MNSAQMRGWVWNAHMALVWHYNGSVLGEILGSKRPHPPCVDGEYDSQAKSEAAAGPGPIRLVRMVNKIIRLTFLIAVWFLAPAILNAQAAGPFYEQEPFDLLTLKEGANAPLKLLQIEIKPRRPLRPPPSEGKLQVRLFDNPLDRFEVAWQDIVEVQLFEEMLLDAAAALVEAKRYDEAFEFYRVLEAKYADFPGVAEAAQSCLSAEAAEWARQGQHDQAIAILVELHRRNPGHSGLQAAMSKSVDALVESHLQVGNIMAARRLVELLASRYENDPIAIARIEAFSKEAADALASARAEAAAGEWGAAYQEVVTASEWWPKLAGLDEFSAEVRRHYSVAVIAVEQFADPSSAPDPTTWTGRRIGTLAYPTLVELTGPGDVGGSYASRLGAWLPQDDGRKLELELSASVIWPDGTRVNGNDVSRAILERANSESGRFDAAWRDLLASTQVTAADWGTDGGAEHVHCELRRKHLLPIALLQVSVDPWQHESYAGPPAGFASYVPVQSGDRSLDETTYWRRVGLTTQPAFAEIVERRFDSFNQSLAALRSGQIVAIDRVPPRHVARLRNVPEILVEPYAMPSVHFLVPNLSKPPMNQRLFRRAIAYALDARAILNDRLLAGSELEGCQLLRGPFPRGYASSDSIEPYPSNLGLAAALARAAITQLEAAGNRASDEVSDRPPLVLVHPPGEIARAACEAIREQLARIGPGLKIELQETTSDSPTTVKRGDFDLLYVEWVGMEPLVDARRLLGPGSLTNPVSNPLEPTLRKLETAGEWADARRAFADLNDRVHEQLLILPLFQISDHFAAVRSLTGVGSRPVSLYQHIDQWSDQPRSPRE